MKILLVTGVYPPQIGGPSAQTKQLAQELIKRGIETRVVTYGSKASEVEDDGVPTVYLDGSRQGGSIEKISKNYRVCQRLGQIMESFRPDVVHQQTAVANLAYYTGVMSRRAGIPSVLKYSSDPVPLIPEPTEDAKASMRRLPSKQQISHQLQLRKRGFLFSLYDSVWATTPEYESRLVDRFGVPSTKVLLRPNFIDLSRFQQVAESREQPSSIDGGADPTRPRKILTVSRLEPFKGVDLCIEAIARLRDLPVTLSIAGDGSEDYVAQLHDLVRQREIEDRVEFLGSIPPEQIHEQYADADVFLLPSRYEPFGIVLVEAMAAGVPVVASRVGGIPAVVGDDAMLVPSDDPTALTAAVRKVLEHPNTHEDLVRRGRRRATRFGLEAGCERMLQHYLGLTRGSLES